MVVGGQCVQVTQHPHAEIEAELLRCVQGYIAAQGKERDPSCVAEEDQGNRGDQQAQTPPGQYLIDQHFEEEWINQREETAGGDADKAGYV